MGTNENFALKSSFTSGTTLSCAQFKHTPIIMIANKRASICYVITKSEIAGAQAHVAELIDGFLDQYKLTVVSGDKGYLTEHAGAKNVTTHICKNLCPVISLKHDTVAIYEIERYLRANRFDLVHAHSSKAGFIARMAARRAGIPSIFTAHGWAFAEGIPLLKRLLAVFAEIYAARHTNRIITVSKKDRTLGLRFRVADQDKLVTIHNGIRDIKSLDKHERGQDQFTIVMVARFTPQKDQFTLVKALKRVNHSASLMLVGDGPTRSGVQNLVRELNLTERVVFLGTRKDVHNILTAADVFVLTSNWEGLPISVLEALRAGRPVIATNTGGIPETVFEGENGFLIPRGNDRILAEQLNKLIADNSLRRQFGAASRRIYEQSFRLERFLQKTQKLYHQVLQQRPAGRLVTG